MRLLAKNQFIALMKDHRRKCVSHRIPTQFAYIRGGELSFSSFRLYGCTHHIVDYVLYAGRDVFAFFRSDQNVDGVNLAGS